MVYLILGLISLKFIRDGAAGGIDLEVFWQAARGTLHGVSPYHHFIERVGLVFKYPPWVLPIFFPFSFLSLSAAKTAWAVGEAVSFLAICHWLMKSKVSGVTTVVTALFFWSTLFSHFQMGQITLLVTAVSLWAYRRWKGELTFIFLALSAKIFSTVAIGSDWNRLVRIRSVLSAVLFCLVLSLPALWTTPSHFDVIELLRNWAHAAGSGGTDLGSVRDWGNQGFPAMFLRMFAIPAARSSADLVSFVACVVLFAPIWIVFSRKLNSYEQWTNFLAFAVVVHPLAWFHTFVLAFPLCAISLDQGLKSKSKLGLFCSGLGLVFVGLISTSTLGNRLGGAVLNLSIRSWGVFLCSAGLWVSVRGRVVAEYESAFERTAENS